MTAQRRFEDSFITTQKLRQKGAIFVVHQQTKIKKKDYVTYDFAISFHT